MSKLGDKWPLSHAQHEVGRLDEIFKETPAVIRAQIAGSVRRGKPEVGDLDYVMILDPENPWAIHALEAAIGNIGWFPTSGGAQIKHYDLALPGGKLLMDIYVTSEEQWGTTLLVRTGSAAHNIKLVQHGARRIVPARRLHVSRGIVDTAGNVVASRTEEQIFAALQLPYVKPADREAPEFEYMVGAEQDAVKA